MKLSTKKYTFRSKLIIAIMVCCSFALLLNNLLVFSLGAEHFKKNKAVNVSMLAEILAKSSTAALVFSDKPAATETLQSAVVDKTIQFVILFDGNCQVFAEYHRTGIIHQGERFSEFMCEGESSHFFSDDYLYLSIVVDFDNQQIGSLLVKSSLSDWYASLFQQLQLFIVLFLVTLLLAFLLTLRLQAFLLLPIKDLLSAIRHISQHQDYSVQVRANTQDELALLAAEFNTMIVKIKCNEEVLNDHNQLLEFTVEQRTQELQENLQQLKLAKEVADSANKAKSDFLSHMSHDLRTPLNGLLGYAQLLQRHADFPEAYRHEIKVIEQSGKYLLSLINDLLDLTKIESSTLDLHLDVFSTTEFLNLLADMYSNLAQQRGFEFQYQFDDNLPQALYGDENRIKRILSNLLDNAFKFTEQGTVLLKVRYTDKQLLVLVEDSGCGIKDFEIDAIFEPFMQFSNTFNNDGVGLGLYITQYLVDLMQGRLTINSQWGKGTKCQVAIPLSIKALDEPVFNKYDSIVSYQGDVKTVMIVDDIVHNLDILENMLHRVGFKVICVNSGLACLEQLQIEPVDLVLLDLVMAGIDGIETCTRIKQLDLQHSPKIFMLTANAFAEDRQQSMQAGCNDFIAKPVLFNQLLAKIEQQLEIQWVFPAENVPDEPKALTNNPLRILVVDDNELNRLLMEHYLDNMNVQVTYGNPGALALELVQQHTFDCIFLDYIMPEKTGLEIADYIRCQETPNKTSYLILMSAFLSNEIKEAAAETGVDAVLAKPIELDDLSHCIMDAQKRCNSDCVSLPA